jgi:hypothetical protein
MPENRVAGNEKLPLNFGKSVEPDGGLLSCISRWPGKQFSREKQNPSLDCSHWFAVHRWLYLDRLMVEPLAHDCTAAGNV